MWLLNPYRYTRQYSAPVSNYLDQVIAADVAAGNLLGLEDGTKTAIATFIDNLIVDGYLGVTGGTISQASSIIKASCILSGARTLAGALVPLVGTAPTNFNFVAGDYNRKTGLVGNGSTKYLNSNRNNNADPQNSKHISVYASANTSPSRVYIGAGGAVAGRSSLGSGPTSTFSFAVVNSTASYSCGATNVGFMGASRASSAAFTARGGGSTLSHSDPSAVSSTPTSGSIYVFARENNSSVAEIYTDARLAFYSIGESLNLALLDARVTTLVAAFAAAIP
jgi:hypothetical protein